MFIYGAIGDRQGSGYAPGEKRVEEAMSRAGIWLGFSNKWVR